MYQHFYGYYYYLSGETYKSLLLTYSLHHNCKLGHQNPRLHKNLFLSHHHNILELWLLFYKNGSKLAWNCKLVKKSHLPWWYNFLEWRLVDEELCRLSLWNVPCMWYWHPIHWQKTSIICNDIWVSTASIWCIMCILWFNTRTSMNCLWVSINHHLYFISV
jgi:hypothetical protein